MFWRLILEKRGCTRPRILYPGKEVNAQKTSWTSLVTVVTVLLSSREVFLENFDIIFERNLLDESRL